MDELYFSEQKLMEHIPNEERAKSLARRLYDAITELSRSADGEDRPAYNEATESSYALRRFTSYLLDYMDEMQITFRVARKNANDLIEEDIYLTKHKLGDHTEFFAEKTPF